MSWQNGPDSDHQSHFDCTSDANSALRRQNGENSFVACESWNANRQKAINGLAVGMTCMPAARALVMRRAA